MGRRMLRMELPGKRTRGRPKRMFMDVLKENMAEVSEEDTEDRTNWDGKSTVRPLMGKAVLVRRWRRSGIYIILESYHITYSNPDTLILSLTVFYLSLTPQVVQNVCTQFPRKNFINVSTTHFQWPVICVWTLFVSSEWQILLFLKYSFANTFS